ncbi:MAG: hypothetical protein IJX88_05305 [Clostridia bacterium]|nr:hypothetical protein [Clostridia bacterium]
MKNKNSKEKKKPAAKKPAAGKKVINNSTKNNKTKQKSEFRVPNKRPNDTQPIHPLYIYKKRGKSMFGLAITHDEKGANRSKTKALDKNPNPKDDRQARIKKKAEVHDEKNLGPRLKGWSFWTQKDRDTVNALIRQNNTERQ